MQLKGLNAHAAGTLLAACAAFLCGACSPSDDSTNSPATLVMQSDSSSADFGAVDLAPLGARTRASLRSDELALEEWQEFFAVYAGDTLSVSDATLAVLGTYSVTDAGIRFAPRFKPVAGQTYTARFDSKALRRFVRASRDYASSLTQFTIARDTGPSVTLVRAIYPTTDSVPMNLLRMYIEFSAPMSVAESRRRIRVLDESGAVVPDALLNIAGGQELWDDERRRLTIFFDPGRIKRDLRPNEELGLPLREGRRYRVVVDAGWKDATGKPLARGFEKRLRVGPVDRGIPRIAAWRVTAPPVTSREPLVIRFPEPMDRALAMRMLAVKRADGSTVDGAVELADRETTWRFTPVALWGSAAHYVEVDSEFEDLAGNSLIKLFDVAPGDTASRGVSAATVRVEFTPTSRGRE